MRTLRLCTLACASLAGGCMLFTPKIRYDLTASVEGVVGKADIHEVAGDYYAKHSEAYFWENFANDHRQLLRVRLSTSEDLVSFANRKGVWISVKWHFCDKPRHEVSLGGNEAFVKGTRVPSIPRRPSLAVADGTGRFGYDAILHVRDARPVEQRWLYGREDTGVLRMAFDLVREPRNVCVRVLLSGKMRGYETNVARIPKEEIAAALGVVVPLAPSDPGKMAR